MTTQFDYDFLVIGAGSGGVRASRRAAATGAKVAVVEMGALGGTCVNVGCVPKKWFSYAAHYHDDFRDAEGYGFAPYSGNWSWSTLRDNKDKAIRRLNTIYRNLLRDAGVEMISGKATFIDQHTITVDKQQYRARHILVATGSQATVPDIPGNEYAYTSDNLFSLHAFPNRVVIVGGGYIALEFAGILSGLGADTTLVYRGELPLRGFDKTTREFLCAEMEKKGIHIKLNTEVEALQKENKHISCQLSTGDSINTDCVFYATGRHPNTAGLGLEHANVALQTNGAIEVNEYYQTSTPSIYAVGDVIAKIQLTPVAIKEAMAVVQTLFHDTPSKVDYQFCPKAVFSQPNMASVGYTEEEARAEFSSIECFHSEFKALKLSLSNRNEKTYMKLVVNTATDAVIGAHMVGNDAAEIIQGIAIALKAGATKSTFDSTIGIHPSSAEEFVTMT